MRLWIVVALLCVTSAMAEQMDAYVSQPTTIVTSCIRNLQLRSSATASIIIYDNNYTIVVPQTNMTPAGNGSFTFTHTFTQIGTYNTREICDFGGILADGVTFITVKKPTFGNMQVIPQGVNQVRLNRDVTSEWLLLLLNSTNQTDNSSIKVTGGSCNVQELNGTALNASVTTATTNDRLTATFTASSSSGFLEGENYQILCNISLTDGMYVIGVKNYVYVNEHVSFLQYLLQLIGLAEEASSTLNQTLNISNQTLAIVSALNSSGATVYELIPKLSTPGNVIAYTKAPVIISTKLLKGSANVPDAICYGSITDVLNGTIVVANTSVYDVSREVYSYNWTPDYAGSFESRWNCTGGASLNTTYVYDTTSVQVNVRTGIKAVIVS